MKFLQYCDIKFLFADITKFYSFRCKDRDLSIKLRIYKFYTIRTW